MRRRFLAALLLVVCAAAVLASSATAKKMPPPPTPSGTFTLSPGATIAFTNMTLDSDNGVAAGYCVSVFAELVTCEQLGSNSGAPGQVVPLADDSYTNTSPFTMTIQLALIDGTAGWIYFSDGMLRSVIGGSEPQPGNHARLGWTADASQILVSINDGSQNSTTDWQPTLGEGNLNATVQVTPPPPTGWTITKIDGYSDDPVLDETTNTYSCSFHTEITYTSNKSQKAKRLTGDGAYVYLLRTDPLAVVGYTSGPLAASPVDTSSWGWGASETALTAGEYAFIVEIADSNGDMLASQITSTFTLNDPTTYTDTHGCPPKGLLVSTAFGA